MGTWGIGHWIVVAVVVMLLFGRGKISELMGDAAKGIKAFKKGMADDDKTADAKPDSMKTIDSKADGTAGDPLKQHAHTERKFEGTAT